MCASVHEVAAGGLTSISMANAFSNMLLFEACSPNDPPPACPSGGGGGGEPMPELFSFESRGAAEVVRLAFAVRGVPYQEVTITDPESLLHDPEGFPFGQVPRFRDTGALAAAAAAAAATAGVHDGSEQPQSGSASVPRRAQMSTWSSAGRSSGTSAASWTCTARASWSAPGSMRCSTCCRNFARRLRRWQSPAGCSPLRARITRPASWRLAGGYPGRRPRVWWRWRCWSGSSRPGSTTRRLGSRLLTSGCSTWWTCTSRSSRGRWRRSRTCSRCTPGSSASQVSCSTWLDHLATGVPAARPSALSPGEPAPGSALPAPCSPPSLFLH